MAEIRTLAIDEHGILQNYNRYQSIRNGRALEE